MRTVFYIISLAFILLSCKKDDESKPQELSGTFDNIGLIQDFKAWEPPITSIHIDPENTNDELANGSIEHPYSSFSEITWYADSVYVLKRGTVLKSPQILIPSSGITIASYGSGDRPVIHCTDKTVSGGNRHGIICHWNGIDDVTIRDIEVLAPEATSCIRFLSGCNNLSVINCKLHDSSWGLRYMYNKGLYVYNTEVYNTHDDGIFIQGVTEIEILNCYVHDVNTNWKPPSTPETEAAGDGIQLDQCNNWRVHHNYIDRMNSGNKFCFISNNADQNDGILEYNYLLGPEFDGSSVYFHNGDNLIVRYNYMKEASGSPIYSHASNNQFYGNVFDKVGGPLFASADAKVYHNVFYHMPLCIQGKDIEAVNNIYDSEEGANIFHVSNLSGSNNLFVTGDPTEGSFSGNPMFVDPENGDFHLQEGSDCIDKGKNADIYFDMDGNKIPNGNAPDIGVFEY